MHHLTTTPARPSRLRLLALAVIAVALLSTTGCQYAYLQLFQTKSLLPPVDAEPVVDNEASVAISGGATVSGGEIADGDSSNYTPGYYEGDPLPPAQFRDGYENIHWTVPDLTGHMSVTWNTGKVVTATLRGALARVHGDYSYGTALAVGGAYSFPWVGFRAQFELGSYRSASYAEVLIDDDAYYDTVRIVDDDEGDYRLGLQVSVNNTQPIYGFHIGARIRMDHAFAYRYEAEDNSLRVRLITVSPGLFVSRQFGDVRVSAGYTYLAASANGISLVENSIHAGWVTVGYVFGLGGSGEEAVTGDE